MAVETQSAYRDIVAAAGRGDRLVQALTDEPRHVGQSAPEIAAALEALRQLVASGTKPTPQSIAEQCKAMQKLARGDCGYHPDFVPKPFSTRFYPRALRAQ